MLQFLYGSSHPVEDSSTSVDLRLRVQDYGLYGREILKFEVSSLGGILEACFGT